MKRTLSLWAGLCVFVGAGASLASQAPDRSLRPMARPVEIIADDGHEDIVAMAGHSISASMAAPVAAKTPLPVIRPVMRPPSPQLVAVAHRPAGPFLGPDVSLRPVFRPDSVVQQALFGKRKKRKGSVCGDLDIQGEAAGDIGGPRNGCYIKDAVRVKSVAGVRLSQPSLMTCDTAKTLSKWVDKGLQPAFKKQGPVVELKVAAHYACRTRNNQRGAKLSEHAKGRAIDISGFVMKDGDLVTVLKDWGKGRDGKSLSLAHKSACGPFGTVLGPQSDRHHRDHFHFDTARYRSGAYCR